MELLSRFSRKNPVLVGESQESAREPSSADWRGALRMALFLNRSRKKAILVLDLPPLRVLEKDGSWHERLDRALVAAAEDGKIFFFEPNA